MGAGWKAMENLGLLLILVGAILVWGPAIGMIVGGVTYWLAAATPKGGD